eukprot:symbB.v1.2.034666.t1/scaffold4509.1/size38695/1
MQRLVLLWLHGMVGTGNASTDFTASVQVLADEDSVGSAVALTLASAAEAPSVAAPWQLCFTWLKAVVLRHPAVSGSYVCLPSVQEILGPSNVRSFLLELAAPSMRHVSDLPRNLHIVSSRREGEEIYDVQLAMPGEAQVRLDPHVPSFTGIPQPMTHQLLKGGFTLKGLGAPVELQASTESSLAAKLLKDWLQTWPPGAPLWPAANDANDANDASRRTWTLKTASPKNEVEHDDGEVGFEDVNEAYELRIEDEALELLASSQEGFLRGVATIRQLFGVALAEGWPRTSLNLAF